MGRALHLQRRRHRRSAHARLENEARPYQRLKRDRLAAARIPKAPPRTRGGRPMSRRREDNEPQWLNGGNRDDAGNLISNLRNAMLALHGDPQVSTCFALDEMSRHVMVVNELPLALDRRNSTDESLPRPLADTDATRIQSCLQSRGL